MPDRVFDGPVKELIFGNERAVLEFPGAGHSLDNMIVYLPGKKIIFGGCFVFEMNKKNTGFTADGDIKEWKLNINKLKTDGYKIIIPGHGLEGGVELIEHTRNVLEIE
jgi:glyoxylase-like metal-dependent hydrolase (beta-lactamase superfamily II)